jgi:maleamate amidohydrolase
VSQAKCGVTTTFCSLSRASSVLTGSRANTSRPAPRRCPLVNAPFGGDRRAPLTNAVEGTAEAGFPDGIAPRPEDYVFLKRRPSAFYGTGVAQLLRMLRRDTIIIGGGANRGVETSVREAFNLNLACIVVRECCWSGDSAAHAYSLNKAMKMYARIRTLDQVAAMLRE